MISKRVTAFLFVSLLLALALVMATTVLAAGGAPLETSMSGAEEAPGPGDPDGSGWASIWLNVGQRTVCWEWSVENIDPVTAAHIHRAPVGSPGPVVVALPPTDDDSSSGCAEGVDKDLIKDIIQNPEMYYVNVHNAIFGPGAVRGQLSHPGQSD